MSLVYKEGCLIEALKSGEVQAIGHQANCFHTMNSGVAKAIRLAFPGAYLADIEQSVKGDLTKMGKFSIYQVRDGEGEPDGLIYNLYSQGAYGYDRKTYTDYDAMVRAMTLMKADLLTGFKLRKVGFPKIGAGLGGGDWTTIEAIINRVFDGDFEVTIYIKE